nr:MAG TPA: Baseplate wedge protein [Caudoviricetes sp.]
MFNKNIYGKIMPIFNNDIEAPTTLNTDASEFEGNGVVNLVYPDDLVNNREEYGNSYTVFFISVHHDSVLQSGGSISTTEKKYTNAKGSAIKKLATEQGGQTVLTGGAALGMGTAMGALGSKAGSMAGGVFGGNAFGMVGKGVGVTIGASVASEFVSDQLVDSTGKSKVEYKQQKACIVLPTPNVSTNYSLSWSETDNFTLGNLMEIGGNIGNTLNSENVDGFMNTMGEIVKKNSDIGLALMSKAPMYGDVLSKAMGKTYNPRKEQLFKEVNFRDFNFTYTFSPRSEQEAKNVMAIINQFKYHAHPDMKDGDFLFIYPSEFDIVHYFDGRPNKLMPRHATSVLNSVTIDYSPNGNYSVFPNGMPTMIRMTLNFKELAILTKKDIAAGY